MEKIVIVGGGVAGLSCLNRLLDQQVFPVLLEGGKIGTPKMCGEFLAPACVSLLNHWDITMMQTIPHAKFFSHKKLFDLHFQPPAAAAPRNQIEQLLAERARNAGGEIREMTKIQSITPGTLTSPFIFHLASGEEIKASSAIFATGKFANKMDVSSCAYYGMKAHLNFVAMPDTLLMHSLKAAYFGLVPISNTVSNFACIAKQQAIQKIGSCKVFFEELVKTHPVFHGIKHSINLEEIHFFDTPLPDFKAKEIPRWPRTYWIGDALASFYPAIGSGFAHAICSGILAADAYLQNNPAAYLVKTRQLIKPKLRLGGLLHKIMLNPNMASLALPVLNRNAWFLNQCLRKLEF